MARRPSISAKVPAYVYSAAYESWHSGIVGSDHRSYSEEESYVSDETETGTDEEINTSDDEINDIKMNRSSHAILQRSCRNHDVRLGKFMRKYDSTKVFQISRYKIAGGGGVVCANLHRISVGHDSPTKLSLQILIMRFLGHLRLAPRVFDIWAADCKSQGYVGMVLMENVRHTLDENYNYLEESKMPPQQVERQILSLVEAMLLVGVAHKNVMLSTIGVVHNRLVLRDFTIAQSLHVYNKKQMNTGWYSEPLMQGQMISHLYQILQDAPPHIRRKSMLSKAIQDLRRGTYNWGTTLTGSFQKLLRNVTGRSFTRVIDFRKFTEEDRLALVALRGQMLNICEM